MPSSQVASVLLMLSAVSGGAVALVVAGIALRAGLGATAASGAAAGSLARMRLGAGLALVAIPFALAAALVRPAAVRDFVLLAGASGVALAALAGALSASPERAAGRAAVASQTAALAMAAAWGDRLVPADGAGRAFPFAFAAVLVLASTFLAPLPARFRLLGPAGAAGCGALAAYLLANRVFDAPELWLPAAGGCGLAAAVSVVLALAGGPEQEAAPALRFALVVLAGGAALLLVGRLGGMAGVSLAAVGLLPLALFQARPAAGIAALLTAIFAGRALLQWVLGEVGLGPGGLDVTQPYAFAALVGGLALPSGLAIAAPHLRGMLATMAASVLLVVLGPLAAVVLQAEALPALLCGTLGGAIALGGTGTPVLPVFLVYTGTFAALAGPRLAEMGVLPAPWRLGAFLALAVLFALALGGAVAAGGRERALTRP